MYKQFYLMQKEPFDSHPSPELFYKSNPHQKGWNYLFQGLKQNEPLLLVAGEYGAGKTLLCLKLIRLLEKNSHLPSVFIPTPTYNFVMVLEKILVELGVPIGGYGTDTSDEARLQQAIYDYFEKSTDGKKKFIYVVIDDAQEFSYDFINKLRLFSSYNFLGNFPIRIILFAHHSFFKMLEYKKIVAFGQRIKRIYYLRPLGFEETREYIYFRLIHSGATGTPIFDDEAIKLIQALSKGSPRLINNICDNCLMVASNERCNLISQTLVRQTMKMGNLVGFETIQEPRVPHGIPATESRKAQFPDDAVQGRQYAAPSNNNYIPRKEPGPGPNNMGESVRREQHFARVTPTREIEADLPEWEEKKKNSLKNMGSRYGKMGIIIALTIIIMFLLFYLFNQNKSNEINNLQGYNEQTIKPGSEYLYVVESSDVLKRKEMFKKDKTTPSLHSIKYNNEAGIEKRYHPVIAMEKLM